MKFIGNVDVEGNFTVNGEEVGSGGVGKLYLHHINVTQPKNGDYVEFTITNTSSAPITDLTTIPKILVSRPEGTAEEGYSAMNFYELQTNCGCRYYSVNDETTYKVVSGLQIAVIIGMENLGAGFILFYVAEGFHTENSLDRNILNGARIQLSIDENMTPLTITDTVSEV